MGSETRKRETVIKVRCTDSEKEQIQAKAAQVSIPSLSRYLRELGMGHTPKSTLDAQTILQLVKVAGDQGRLGGLLKWWLSEGLAETPKVKGQMERLLKRLEQTQDQIDALVNRL
ncbi:plasmid mobilization protein [Microbulbifer aggregans]|uniref:plasmid mobilization protein n=1 Tax=Microbulbifer aggregans TaxID=1769779 RepID=UPI001CFF1F09|nr:conjugal transfer protein TraJ [Microbulbifer aggregans]